MSVMILTATFDKQDKLEEICQQCHLVVYGLRLFIPELDDRGKIIDDGEQLGPFHPTCLKKRLTGVPK